MTGPGVMREARAFAVLKFLGKLGGLHSAPQLPKASHFTIGQCQNGRGGYYGDGQMPAPVIGAKLISGNITRRRRQQNLLILPQGKFCLFPLVPGSGLTAVVNDGIPAALQQIINQV